jgi:hypothetical protein
MLVALRHAPADPATTSAGLWSCTCPALPSQVRHVTMTRLVRPGRRQHGKWSNLGLQQPAPDGCALHSNAKRSNPTLEFHDVQIGSDQNLGAGPFSTKGFCLHLVSKTCCLACHNCCILRCVHVSLCTAFANDISVMTQKTLPLSAALYRQQLGQ